MTVCKKLWYNAEIDLSGQFQPCSSFNGSISCRPYDINSYLSSPDLKRYISDHQQGIKNLECKICWDQEEHGHRSLRESSEDILPNISDEPRILFLDYSLDHLCNLKCIMCSEVASSAIMTEKLSLGLPIVPITLNTDPDRLNFLEKHIKDLKELKIYNSGEPLMSPKFKQLIEIVCRENPELKLMISTNGTKISDEILNQLNTLKNLTLKVSLDGFDRINDFIRYPSQWKIISKNIDSFLKLSNADILVHSTVQALNLYQLDSLIKWALDKDITIELSPVNRSPTLDIRVIPLASREIYKEKILKILRTTSLNPKNLRVLLATLKQLDQQDFCDQSHRELKEYLANVCNFRGINLIDYMPAEVELLQINI